MIYFSDGEVTVRTMSANDPAVICREEILQGWHASEEKYLMRLAGTMTTSCCT